MANGSRVRGFSNFLNRYNKLVSFRIKKIVNDGGNNLDHSAVAYCTSNNSEQTVTEPLRQSRINKAVLSYLERAREYELFLKAKMHEYEEGRKFLAKITGKKVCNFNQKEMDEALKYLFPSGLHERLARPMLKNPEVLYGQRKEAQFDGTGRPYHYLYYTTKPKYSQVLHECAHILQKLNEKLEEFGPRAIISKVPPDVSGTEWFSKEKLEETLLEKLLDVEYSRFIEGMDRLLSHPYAFESAHFIMQYRYSKSQTLVGFERPDVEIIKGDVKSVTIKRCKRKSCTGTVTLLKPGTGKLTINGKNLIDFFEDVYPREEVG